MRGTQPTALTPVSGRPKATACAAWILAQRFRGETVAFGLPLTGVSAVVLALVALALLAFALPLTRLAFAQAPSPTFTVLSADGTSHTGQLTKIGADWSLRLAGNKPALLSGEDVLTLRQQRLKHPPFPTGPQVVLGNGDRLPLRGGRLPSLVGEQLRLEPASPLQPFQGDRLEVSLGVVALIWFANPEPETASEIVLRRLLKARRSSDLILLRNGDALEGAIGGLSATECKVEWRGRIQAVPTEQLAVVAFRSDVLFRVVPKTLHGQLVLEGGARLTLTKASIDASGQWLVGTSTFRSELKIPLTSLAELTPRRGRAVYLSELTPSQVRENPFLGVSWPPVRDGNVRGDSLQIGTRTFDRGLGLHSGVRVTYSLDGQYRRFQAEVGLDGRTGKQGRVRVQMLLDGRSQEIFPRGRDLRSQDRVPVDISVVGARELTLIVEPGVSGPIQGHVNWGDARLVR